MTIQNRAQIEPFITADGSEIREFLHPGNSQLKNQSLAEATLSPGECTAAHFHPCAEEIYFILSGVGILKIERETRKIRVGDTIAIPNGDKHQICNTGEADLVFLCACAPAYGHSDTILVTASDDFEALK